MAVLTNKLEVDRIDAALLAEELAEILHYSYPKGLARSRKGFVLIDWDITIDRNPLYL